MTVLKEDQKKRKNAKLKNGIMTIMTIIPMTIMMTMIL